LSSRLPLIDPDTAQGAVKQTLDELSKRGPLGPMIRGMANSSALLRGYLELSRAMKRSHLDRTVSERVSLAVQEWIGCHRATWEGRLDRLGDVLHATYGEEE